ncbi:HlyD family efflux transporter periplasmic adaptor subunit [Synechococcus elongatus]|uniref:ABC-transporter membrane fusion protein n=3 Tax=Synechococcus elongatus TaxID=32046 RepID=Q31NW5_SYNE7|nr:HlyD family efflux transporter periplasmic adaptor subunit [Synechococcus elongatus]MBD2688561.1 HlyD family efflux transporter periplasmic adaptor subunit [Synechococcus elongatus FACHB-1061]ABB57254.1 ABC-transporter membrane fusion protein [Synechococcus elongatus PCC 7942 = FACHB-805]AJD58232.1 lipid ABC transporter permease [Synechococcus elongatus UTEX 2973]MBD2587660.1 HlyD family efflux transporter periplasmic adaptor subunit [Synechococcus elongatus FACHB-242]MBD2707632.1 HlyD fami
MVETRSPATFKPALSGNRQRWLIYGGLAIVVIGGVAFLRSRSAAPPEPAPVAQTQVDRYVGALGRLEPEGRVVKLTAPQSGFSQARIADLRVEEGDRVSEGQILAVLDNQPELAAAAAAANSAVAVATADLNRILAGAKSTDRQTQQQQINRIQAELAIAQREYDRNQALFQSGAIAATALDSKRLDVERLQGELAVARSTLASLSEAQPEEVQLAQARLAQARAQAQEAAAQLANTVIRAPFAGQVLRVNSRPGESGSDDGVIELARTDRMQVVAEVYETDVGRIRVGQPVTITSEHGGFSGSLTGRVALIGGKIDKKGVFSTDPASDIDSRVVEVRIDLDPSDRQKVSQLTNLQVLVRIDAGRS